METDMDTADTDDVGFKTGLRKEEDESNSPLDWQFEDDKQERTDDDETDTRNELKIENGEKIKSCYDNETKFKGFKSQTDGDDDTDLYGYDAPLDFSKEDIHFLIEKLEKELGECHSVQSSKFYAVKKDNFSPTPDTVSSRPSSGMSMHSESDLIISLNEGGSVPGAGSNRSSVSRKSGVDLSNPMYKLPFEYGWKRELVFRATLDQSMRRQADVYYYAPTGKKLRSTREVGEHLTGTELTTDHFTFFKEPLGIDDPEKEIIRGAKIMRSRVDSPQSSFDQNEGLGNTVEGKRIPKPKHPKGSSPDHILARPFKVKSVGSRLGNSGAMNTSPPSKTANRDASVTPPKVTKKSISADVSQTKKSMHDAEVFMDHMQTQYGFEKFSSIADKAYFGHTQEQSSHVSAAPRIFPSVVSDLAKITPTPQNKKYGSMGGNQTGGRDMCPMRCPLAYKEPPTLQCSLCLCLYHSQCTGFLPNSNTSFVCKNCHLANSGTSTPPPQPIGNVSNTKAGVKPSAMVSSSPVPQRIPKPPATNKVPQPRLVPVVNPARQKSPYSVSPKHSKSDPTSLKLPPKTLKSNCDSKISKNIKNSPNSWSQSNVQMSHENIGQMIPNKPNDVDPSIFPQCIAILNGHKFIVVPRPNTYSTSSLVDHMNNPKQGDNAPKIMESNYPAITSASTTSVKTSKATEDAKEDSKSSVTTITAKSESASTNVITFDNLSSEYGKLLYKNENLGADKNLKRSASLDSEDAIAAKRKPKAPPTPKIIPKIVKKTENGTDGQKGIVRNNKSVDGKKNYFAEFYKTSMERGYDSLIQIFSYLKMRELAAAARVCRMWREIADTPALWKSVRMKNTQVNDWQGLAATLKNHSTKHLDLRKMLHHHPPEVHDKTWDQFIEHISTVDTLIRLDLCRCPASVVERVCERMSQLQTLTATSVRCTTLNPANLAFLKNLQELRIKGMSGLTLTSDLKCLENLTRLKHLSITSVQELGLNGVVAIGNIITLESLELGECTGDVGGPALLKNLENLTRLRLERCPGANGGATLLRGASALPLLQQLELINFDIKPGFEEALGKCANVKRLLVIPTYISQSATTNRCVLEGVLRLRNTLTHFAWGVTLELLRVTELFIDQCDKSNQAQLQSQSGISTEEAAKTRKTGASADCIPVLKPVPGLPVEESRTTIMTGRPQVEILPLAALQRLLNTELPNTRLKILRIPYHHTWRQTFNDFD